MDGRLEGARSRYEEAHAADDLGRFSEALAGYRAVDDLLQDGDDEALRVRAWLGIARCTYEVTGDLAGAHALLERAAGHAEEHGLPAEVFAGRGQLALLQLRSGDPTAALATMQSALPTAEHEGLRVDGSLHGLEPSRDLAVFLLNRGALLLESGQVDQAVDDLDASASVAAAVGIPALESMARHNLGYAAYVRGDLPAALRHMSAASQGSTPEPVALLDRARVLADAGLVTDAVTALEQAVSRLEGGSVLVRAEVELDLAARFMDLMRHDAAVAAAGAAARAFAQAGNMPWSVRSQVVALEAMLGADRWLRARSTPEVMRERAQQALALAARGEGAGAVGLTVVTYPALLAAAEWAVLLGDVDEARVHLDRVPADLSAAPLSLRVGRSAVRARIAFATGDRAEGVRAVKDGQAEIAAHRGLGSVEAAAATGVHTLRLSLVDLQSALATGSPAEVFDALERGRATSAGAARVVPPDDQVLASLLEQARAASQAAIALGTTAEPGGMAAKREHLLRARRMQEAARERSWQVEGERRPVQPATMSDLRATLRALRQAGSKPVVVSYMAMAGTVWSVRVDDDGESLLEMAALDEVAELVRRSHADLAVVANQLIPAPLRDAAGGSLRRALARLDELLMVPLRARNDLYVIARGRMLTLPWPALPSRHGRRTWVGDRVDLRTGVAEAHLSRPGGVVVVAGPGTDAATREARAVAGIWPGARLLDGDAATSRAALAALGGAAIVHLAAHGGHTSDNALFSSLRLADGPLFAHELDGVDLSGSVVVLSACELGLSNVDVGGEALGFASVLLRHGAWAVVAAVAPLRDDVAMRVMPRFHAALREGIAPGAALASATREETEPVPLVCFGPLGV